MRPTPSSTWQRIACAATAMRCGAGQCQVPELHNCRQYSIHAAAFRTWLPRRMETDGTRNMTGASNLGHGVTRKLARYLSNAKAGDLLANAARRRPWTFLNWLGSAAAAAARGMKPRISRLPLYRLLPRAAPGHDLRSSGFDSSFLGTWKTWRMQGRLPGASAG